MIKMTMRKKLRHIKRFDCGFDSSDSWKECFNTNFGFVMICFYSMLFSFTILANLIVAFISIAVASGCNRNLFKMTLKYPALSPSGLQTNTR